MNYEFSKNNQTGETRPYNKAKAELERLEVAERALQALCEAAARTANVRAVTPFRSSGLHRLRLRLFLRTFRRRRL